MAKERINKINEEVRRELSNIVRELKDTRIPMMTSIVAVKVTNDLSYAKVYVSVMGDETVQKKAIEAFKEFANNHKKFNSAVLKKYISNELSSLIFDLTERKPIIIPIIMELDNI